MIDTSERTVELMNEYHETMSVQSWHTLQHFLVVKIMRLEKKLMDAEYCADNNWRAAQRAEEKLSKVVEELDWAKYDIEDMAGGGY